MKEYLYIGPLLVTKFTYKKKKETGHLLSSKEHNVSQNSVQKKETTIAETFPCKIGVQDIGATSLRETLKFNELVWRCMSQ